MAPEIIERKHYDGKKADMFAVGVILFFLVTGVFPFARASKNDPHFLNMTNI